MRHPLFTDVKTGFSEPHSMHLLFSGSALRLAKMSDTEADVTIFIMFYVLVRGEWTMCKTSVFMLLLVRSWIHIFC